MALLLGPQTPHYSCGFDRPSVIVLARLRRGFGSIGLRAFKAASCPLGQAGRRYATHNQ